MRERWRNVENAQSEKAIVGSACNSKIVSLKITCWQTVVLLTLIAFINSGCIPYWVVHRKNTPLSKETRILSSPETFTVRELAVSAQPTAYNPQIPVTLLYSELVSGSEEEVVKYEEREYRHMWSPLFYPGYILILPFALGFMLTGKEGQPYDEHTREWGCFRTNRDVLLDAAIAVIPCHRPKRGKEPTFKNLPVVEEARPTGRTVEARRPVAQQLVEIKVVAHGVTWQKETVLTVVTDAEGKQRIPLDSMFKEFPNAPLKVSVILTTDEAQTTVHLDSQVSEAIYTHIRK